MALLRKLSGQEYKPELDDIQGIVDNLNNVLNSKRGYSSLLPDFGVSDYHHYTSRSDIAKVIIREVSENIRQFEPRVALTQIIEVKDENLFKLSFRIDCIVKKNARSLRLVLDPVLDKYLVSG